MPVRLHFKDGVAAEHVRGDTYRWVDPVDGTHRGYVVAQEITYMPTLAEQRVYRGNP